MPSTFTTNLGIEKPGDGEQDGIWGDIVNENNDILDRAVNGVAYLTLTGTSSTLTTSDGILSNGQYKMLYLQGTPSGTHTITIAPNDAQKIYYVQNTTTQNIVFTQGSGPAITVSALSSAVIFSDGFGASAGVGNFTDHLSMSSPSITGGTITGITDLSIADGGTGASTAAGALTNFGITVTAAQINTAMPTGGIIIWSGSSGAIPTGWLLCNGANGTPDLRDRFVVGASLSYAVGAMGGDNTVTLNSAQIPAHAHVFSGITSQVSNDHTHSGTTDSQGVHTHVIYRDLVNSAGTLPNSIAANGGISNYGPINTQPAGAHSHSFTTGGISANHTHTFGGTTQNNSGGFAHENRPPYYALCYIMKS